MPLKAKGTLLHRQLYLLLKQQIIDGVYRVGEQLPTQAELCERFSVSRITVRRALGDLEAEGLIRTTQGAGAFVEPAHSKLAAAPRLSFVEEMNRVVDETTVEVLGIALERSPAHVTAVLELPPDVDVLHVRRIRSMGQVPVMFLDAWLPSRLASVVTAQALRSKPLYRLISKDGKDLGGVVQEITPALADPWVASALRAEVNSAVLRIDRLVHDRERRPIQFMTIWSSPAHSRFVMALSGSDMDTPAAGRLQHRVD